MEKEKRTCLVDSNGLFEKPILETRVGQRHVVDRLAADFKKNHFMLCMESTVPKHAAMN